MVILSHQIGWQMAHDLTWQSPLIIPEPNSGCWIWLGQVNQSGYGRARLAHGRKQVAHRAVYEAHHQTTVPADMQLDHLCMVRCCVNPDHMEIVTPLENIRRALRQRRANPSLRYCRNGHKVVGNNILVRKNGKYTNRICRTCAAANRSRHRNKLRAAGIRQ
jgi:hypothetical protein